MYTTYFTIADVEITAEYTVHGSYRPATQWEPEEYPEVEVLALFDELGNELTWDGDFWVQGEWQYGGDVRDFELATEADAWAKAEEICQEWLEEAREYEADLKAEYEYEALRDRKEADGY